MRISAWLKLGLLVATILAFSIASLAQLRVNPHHQTIELRLMGSEDFAVRSTIGPSIDSYIGEAKLKKTDGTQLVRIMYRRQSGEALPSAALNYSVVHSIRVLRDESCDTSLASVEYSYRFDAENRFLGREYTLRPATEAPPITANGDEILPCYVFRPKDYRGWRRLDSQSRSLVTSIRQRR